MSLRYEHLLSPLRIGNNLIKNRLLTPNAMPHFLQGPETFPAEGTRAHLTGMARNGCAVVCLGDWTNYPNQRQGPADADGTHFVAWDMSDPSVHNYFSMMTDEVHMFGSKILAGCRMVYPEGYSLHGGFMPFPMGNGQTEPLPKERFQEVIDAYVERCGFWKGLGFDGINLRLDLEMNNHQSERTDEYNGSPLKRVLFFIEAFQAVKKAYPDFIIEVGLAGQQPYGYGFAGSHQPNGYTIEDTIAFCKAAEGVVDILEIREQDAAKAHPTGFTATKGVYPTIEFSAAIKAAGCKIITAPTGGFQEPEAMEQALREGKCDMFGMARAFFADYDFGKKLYAGRGEEITPCIKCNRCHGTIRTPHDPWVSVCSVNPMFGLQSYLHRLVEAPGEPKKVAVVGGGPAGMRTALFAAQRGHDVTLFEKTDYLGGQLLHAEYFSFKWPIKDYRDWLVRELDRVGVKVRLNTEATPESIRAEGFDAVYAATGAQAQLPASIRGLRDEAGSALYPTCVDVFGREAELGHHVIIVGASETGIETAMYLCENGHEVTMLTRQHEIGHDCSKLHYITMVYIKTPQEAAESDMLEGFNPAWYKYRDTLKGITDVTTVKVEGNAVTYVDAQGAEHVIQGDSVVICGGIKPRLTEALTFAGSADRFFAVGDCSGSCGNLHSCNRDAWAKAGML